MNINDVVITDRLVLSLYNKAVSDNLSVIECCSRYLQENGISGDPREFYAMVSQHHERINPNLAKAT